MTANNIKTQIINQLDQLPPKLLGTVNDFVAFLLTRSSSSEASTATAIEDDPIVGLIKGSPELATNAEEILKTEIQSDSGWSCQ